MINNNWRNNQFFFFYFEWLNRKLQNVTSIIEGGSIDHFKYYYNLLFKKYIKKLFLQRKKKRIL